ncbi:hypothetical protein DFA_07853 [Cavenderia fasciculata]|uniref:Ankyrin repeat-containing protein n=1 Tax=Cavenderia fasciculata TaxID=261658 RepID=F4Q3Q7_CACFS|nr:uncharacterized protein DFA_07853 [Cavenderia fasciculata]EGG16873.1 hypothetical protein DFA_07853 [Cavenderia fasciculata]|eukprot:XP_004355347.1 hypothetical protein DFA_07853 [Cavenderia fasciculata]
MNNNNNHQQELFPRLFKNVIIQRCIFYHLKEVCNIHNKKTHNNYIDRVTFKRTSEKDKNGPLKVYRWNELKDNIDQLSRHGYVDQIKKIIAYQEQVVYPKYRWTKQGDDIPYTPHYMTIINFIVRDGHFDYIQEIWKRLSRHLPEIPYSIIWYAVYYNQTKIFKWAMEQSKEEEYKVVNDSIDMSSLFKPIKYGIQVEKQLNNRDEIIDYLPFETFSNLAEIWPTSITIQSSDLRSRVYKYISLNLAKNKRLETLLSRLIINAVQLGDNDLFKTIQKNHHYSAHNDLFNFQELMCEAASTGNLVALKNLIETNTNIFKNIMIKVLDKAVGKGHLHIVKFLVPEYVSFCTQTTIQMAIENGNIEMVIYLLGNKNQGFSNNTIYYTIDHNRTDLCKVLLAANSIFRNPFDIEDIARRSLQQDRKEIFEIIKARLKIGLPKGLKNFKFRNNDILEYVYRIKKEEGDESSVEYLLFSNAIPMNLQESIEMIDRDYPHFLKNSIEIKIDDQKPSLETIQFLLARMDKPNYDNLFERAIRMDDDTCLKILDFMYQRFGETSILQINKIQNVFKSAAVNRGVSVLQYLWDRFQSNLTVTVQMISLAIKPKQHNLIWLFSHVQDMDPSSSSYFSGKTFNFDFKEMARLGYLSTIKWIVENGHHRSIPKLQIQPTSLDLGNKSVIETTRLLFENGIIDAVPLSQRPYSKRLDPDLFLLLIDMGVSLSPLIKYYRYSFEHSGILRLIYFNYNKIDNRAITTNVSDPTLVGLLSTNIKNIANVGRVERLLSMPLSLFTVVMTLYETIWCLKAHGDCSFTVVDVTGYQLTVKDETDKAVDYCLVDDDIDY